MRVALELQDGLALVDGEADAPVGHLMGWGGNDRNVTPMFMRSTVEHSRRRATWVVRGTGSLNVTASSARTGRAVASLTIA